MKRVHSSITFVSDNTRSKRPKLNPGLRYEPKRIFWVRPTDVKNFMVKDPIVDWLKLSSPRKSGGGVVDNEFVEFIKKRGIEFEEKLVDYINSNRTKIVTVSDRIDPESVQRVIDLMKKGVPVLHSVPLEHKGYRTRGVADLVVRSDYLGRLVDENPLSKKERKISAPNLSGNYHYVVIDIKFSTLPLRANGIHLLNSGNYPAYKAQTWMYNRMIGSIQGYTPRYSYILGRRWCYRSCDIRYDSIYCLDKLGVIDYEGVDEEYVQRTKNAIQWCRDVKQHGRDWEIGSREELYPNMCVDSGRWNKEKKRIAADIGEITNVWYVGVKQRKKALEKNVTSWKDPRCTTEVLGMSGVRARVIDKIMDINRQEEDKIRPKRIRHDLFDWRDGGNEMFVDFETLIDIFSPFDELPKQRHTNQIFMIGVWYRHNSVWRYKNFLCDELTLDEEFRIMNDFVHFVKARNNPRLWYWHAEKTMWKQAETRQFDRLYNNKHMAQVIRDRWNIDRWSDMAQVFRAEPIVIKNCFKFGLKEIVTAMNEHGLIDTRMESECQSGLVAAVKAWNAYKKGETSDLRDIARYNRFDVKALHDIIVYLRRNH